MNEEPKKILSQFEMLSELLALFPGLNTGLIDLPDADYQIMPRAEVDKILAPAVKGFLEAYKLAKWAESFDCDNFAETAHWCAGKMHHSAVEAGHSEAQAPAIGCLSYLTDNDRGHRLNIIRTEQGWKAWEPQLQEFTPVTAQMRSEAMRISF